MKSKEQLYDAAILRWGIPSQLKMLAEECCELAVVVLKQGREFNGAGRNELAEEIADVELCIEQVMHCLKLNELVADWKEKKLRRFAYLLGEE
jgi:NTP pyrophosphatase (non-canonical NTP hydrolase)